LLSQRKIYSFRKSILPIPLSSNYFNSLHRFSNLIIISKNLRKTRKCNLSYNNTRQNSPNKFQRSMMIKTLRYWHRCMMKSIHNTKNKPLNQQLNNNQKKVNISILISNSFHQRCSRILKPTLPCNRGITKNFKQIPYHIKHLTI
jgi:hypothetical protein